MFENCRLNVGASHFRHVVMELNCCFIRFSLWNTMLGTSLLTMPWAISQVSDVCVM